MVALIANPDRFHGMDITLSGIAQFGLERSALFLSTEDVRFDRTAHAAWMKIPADLLEESGHGDLEKPWIGYAYVRGRVDAEAHGHLGAYPLVIHVKELVTAQE